ncbi:MAG: hypothetical protein WBC91_02350 [Phototrophicaceae bacterium]
MFLTNDLLIGILVGVGLTILMQQVLKLGNRLMRPGCLLTIGLFIAIFVGLIFVGIIEFQAFS